MALADLDSRANLHSRAFASKPQPTLSEQLDMVENIMGGRGELAKQWSAMSDAEKQPYVEKTDDMESQRLGEGRLDNPQQLHRRRGDSRRKQEEEATSMFHLILTNDAFAGGLQLCL